MNGRRILLSCNSLQVDRSQPNTPSKRIVSLIWLDPQDTRTQHGDRTGSSHAYDRNHRCEKTKFITKLHMREYV